MITHAVAALQMLTIPHTIRSRISTDWVVSHRGNSNNAGK